MGFQEGLEVGRYVGRPLAECGGVANLEEVDPLVVCKEDLAGVEASSRGEGAAPDHPTAAYVAKVREIRMLGSNVGILRAVVGMIPASSDDVNPAGNTIQTLVAVQNADGWQAALFQCTPAAWHGRPQDRAALTEELREVMRRGLTCR